MSQKSYVSARIPIALMRALDGEATKFGESRTDVLVRALRRYFDSDPIPEETESSQTAEALGIEKRLRDCMDAMQASIDRDLQNLCNEVAEIRGEVDRTRQSQHKYSDELETRLARLEKHLISSSTISLAS